MVVDKGGFPPQPSPQDSSSFSVRAALPGLVPAAADGFVASSNSTRNHTQQRVRCLLPRSQVVASLDSSTDAWGSGVSKPPLTVHNAAIATASVEIKTLTVSGKQVTLAVFRQLQDRQLIHDDGTLAGQPWGVVNYHPDKCANAPTHWHVVWQEDDQLRRSLVLLEPTFDDFQPDEGYCFINSWLHDLAATGVNTYFPNDPPVLQLASNDQVGIQSSHDFPALVGLSQAGVAVANAYLDVQRLEALARNSSPHAPAGWITTQLDTANGRLAAALPALAAEVWSFSSTTDKLFQDYETAIDQEQARRTRHHEARNLIAQLPQLFIAV